VIDVAIAIGEARDSGHAPRRFCRRANVAAVDSARAR
jgi:hypothetical protein